MSKSKIRVLIAKPGLDGHDRGAKVVARALRDAGMEVIYTGLRQTPEQIVQAAVQEDVDALGLSVLSGAHMHLFERIITLLREVGIEDLPVFGGGIIPDQDIPELKRLGVAEIFQPGSTTIEIIEFLESTIGDEKNLLPQLFREEYQRVKAGPAPECRVRFYPYRGLTNTIRSRNGRIHIRISDLLNDAPGEVFRSVMAILIGKLLGTQVDDQLRLQYRRFVNRPEFRQRTLRARRQRGVKRLSSYRGQFHDLLSLFNKINKTYFENKIEIRHLSWSQKPTRSTLGHFDAAHETIIVNRRLDNPRVPQYVLSYVIYHEMLHVLMGEELTENGRRIHHNRFRKAEKEFEEYSKAKAFIRDHYNRLDLA